MQTLNFNQDQPQIIISSECHEEGYEAYFNNQKCPYENHQDEKLSWDIGFRNAQMDDK